MLLFPSLPDAPAPENRLQPLIGNLAKAAALLFLGLLLLAMFLRWQTAAGVREFSLLFFLGLVGAGLTAAALSSVRYLVFASAAVGAFGTFVIFVAVAGLLWPPQPEVPPEAPVIAQCLPPPVSFATQDVVFVVNVADGVQPRLQGIREGIDRYAQGISARARGSRFAVVTFHDRLEAKPLPPETPTAEREPFTRQPELFGQEVGRLQAKGGGDEPESSLDALALAVRQPFRPDADRVLILITDASPKLPDKEMRSLDQAGVVLKEGKVKQLHLVIQDRHRAVYERLRADIPGMTFNLQLSDQAFAQMLPQLGEQIARASRVALPEEERRSVDVMFALDVTGSMGFAILGVKQGINKFAEELFNRNLDARIGLIGFRDQFNFEAPVFEVLQFPAERPPRRPEYNRSAERAALRFGGGPFALAPDDLRAGLKKLASRTRAGAEQGVLDALALAARQPCREGVDRALVLVCDSPPRQPDEEMQSVKELTALLRGQRVQQLHLVVGDVNHPLYREMHQAIPGRLLSLEAVGPTQALESLLQTPTPSPNPGALSDLQAPEPVAPVAPGAGVWLAFLAAVGLAVSFLVLGLSAAPATPARLWPFAAAHAGAALLGVVFLVLSAVGRG